MILELQPGVRPGLEDRVLRGPGYLKEALRGHRAIYICIRDIFEYIWEYLVVIYLVTVFTKQIQVP